MPDITDGGYPFPLATEPIAAGAQNMQDLAEAADERNACVAVALRPFVPLTGQNVPGVTWTAVDLNDLHFESHAGMVDLATNRLIVPYDGVYQFEGGVIWDDVDPTGVWITLQRFIGNVTTEGLDTANPWSNGYGSNIPDAGGIQTSRMVSLDAGDSIELDIWANADLIVRSAYLNVSRVY